MDTPGLQRRGAQKRRKRPADRSHRPPLAALLVALALGGCATAPPPPPAYVGGTLAPPSCDKNTNECDRKNMPPPRQASKCTGFLDLRVIYGTCTE
jgi:hypothetical protein